MPQKLRTVTTMNSSANSNRAKPKLSVREMAVFAMFGAVMYCSKLVMAALPNIHLLGMFTMVLTLVYRKKALVPLYVYVMLEGLFGGFSAWWLPYLYLWTVLWSITMLLPKKLPKKAAYVVYSIVCALHGLCFGLLYAPAQALMFGLNFEQAKDHIAPRVIGMEDNAELLAQRCDICGDLVGTSVSIGGNAALCHDFVVFVNYSCGDVRTAQVDAYIIHKYHVPFCIAYIYKVIILSLPLFVKRDLDGACCEKRSVNCSLSRSGHWSLLSHSDKL